jgi:uncharacterized protein YgbK (DUF1537 family)
MEALASSGVATVLFLGMPTVATAERFKDYRAFGIAGTSRSETPDWMDEHLPAIFEWLKTRGADICHYKVCSTFDSSPAIGNIGRAIEIGRTVFDQPSVPVIVGAPQLKRYTAFGHLFAAYQGRVYRIDRHPVMSRHPVTPMGEADLAVHLAKQTVLPVALADLATITAVDADQRVDKIAADTSGIMLIDVDSAQSQAAAGRQLWRAKRTNGLFTAGSSGVEYALLQAWKTEGLLGEQPEFHAPGKVERLAVVSGSVSPTTERQIRDATAKGFDGIGIDPLELVGENRDRSIDAAVTEGVKRLKAGRSVVLHTALGPGEDRGIDIDRIPGARHRLGSALGIILRRLVENENLSRAIVAGGDTSSHALKELHIDALTTLLPLPQTPGSPLCTAHGSHAPTNGLQVALKGGQVGSDDYFSQIRDGRRA